MLFRSTNKYIDETAPWVLARDTANKDRLDTVLYNLSDSIRIISVLIQPFMHTTTGKIWKQLGIDHGEGTQWEDTFIFGKLPSGVKVQKQDPMFPRIDVAKELEDLEATLLPKEEKLELKPEISIDDFAKVDIKVGEVLACEKHPKADKLLVFKVKIGPETRQVVSGIAKHFEPKDLIGRKVLVVANLKPVILRGIESNGMLLTAELGDKLVLLSADIGTGANIS